MSPYQTLAPEDFAELLQQCADVLAEHAPAVDALAVSDEAGERTGADALVAIDVPDGPGSTLARGVAATAQAVSDASNFTQLGDQLCGSVAGPSGAAGRFWERIVTGWADALRNVDRVDPTRMALMFEAAAEELVARDGAPRLGGATAVAAAAADGALAASDEGAELGDVLLAAADAGLAELERGPLADADLARRGVVDATAAGFLLVVDVMASVVTGEPLPVLPSDPLPHRSGAAIDEFVIRCRLTPAAGSDPGDWLPVALAELGEVRSCAPASGIWGIDVRTALAGAVVQTIADAGRIEDLHIAVERVA
ncbi:MAG: DAK2 domain-containing protein [Actinomycetes bacterium]